MRTDRILARLEQEPERPSSPPPRMSRTRKVLFGATMALYGAIVAAVLLTTELVRVDWQLMLFRPYKQWPEFHAFLDYFVVLGQRAPTAVLVAAWLGWRSWRQRTLRPLLVLATALLLLNATVGAVKIGLGRLGPHYATEVGSAELFAGGDIFPSGHTANAVVTWGILAYLATTPRARRVLSVVAAFFALGVGATTVYLGTHWVSDVLLGWAAGLLILLGLPWCEPVIARTEALVFHWRERLRALAGRPAPGQLPPVARPPLITRAAAAEGPQGATRPSGEGRSGPPGGTGAGGPQTAATGPSHGRMHLPGRGHGLRSECAPLGPGAGSRRPASERPAPQRPAPLGPRGR
ncbi:phosphatase PAP2 family protein [Streptomyces sp. JJ36]|uniref:phosphatase PAP2 family protein n=1 Tax=Streptomyces sp. JJ36 TaxID=2736645 RepID=UPI001F20CC89|nr:phosphatase PAP2 family protein [Streptomyces sp. JJ36]MCF6522472.1 phosphatase PAP2 family protein [Streptomyces sp. JJ36]